MKSVTYRKELRMIWRPMLFLVCTALAACTNHQCIDTGAEASGAALFRINCAGCHGTDARGNGPIAEFLNAPVADLTRIAARNGGQFPAEQVFRTIDGQAGSSLHGARRMPIWGYEFFDAELDDAKAHRDATEKIDRLVGYLHTLQAK